MDPLDPIDQAYLNTAGRMFRDAREGRHDSRWRAGEDRISRSELAQRSGVSAETIKRFEYGQKFPAIPAWIRLCRALGVPRWDFLDEVDAEVGQ